MRRYYLYIQSEVDNIHDDFSNNDSHESRAGVGAKRRGSKATCIVSGDKMSRMAHESSYCKWCGLGTRLVVLCPYQFRANSYYSLSKTS